MSAVHDLTPDELAQLQKWTRDGVSRWQWIYTDAGERMESALVRLERGVVVEATASGGDWTPAEIVRAVYRAHERRSARHSGAAKKAARARARRREKLVYQAAERLQANALTPGRNCIICGRGLGDPESIRRSVGSECWQSVLEALTRLRARA